MCSADRQFQKGNNLNDFHLKMGNTRYLARDLCSKSIDSRGGKSLDSGGVSTRRVASCAAHRLVYHAA